jgi:hypothetical protein
MLDLNSKSNHGGWTLGPYPLDALKGFVTFISNLPSTYCYSYSSTVEERTGSKE